MTSCTLTLRGAGGTMPAGSGKNVGRKQGGPVMTSSVPNQIRDALLAGVVLSAVGAIGSPAVARQVPVDLTGTVVSMRFEPIPSARVMIDPGAFSWTADDGHFLLTDVPPGTFVLSIERAGYASRSFNMVVPDTAAGTIDIGLIDLEPIEGPTGILRGRVRNAVNGQALPATLIALNEAVVALTDDDGVFTVDPVDLGVHKFEVRRVGYFPSVQALTLGTPDTVSLDVTVQPLPIRLDDVEVVADGDRTIYAQGRLAGFYRRRRSTEGDFFVREDIEKYSPVYLSDVLRRAGGVRLDYTTDGRRVPTIRGCRATILLDGMEMMGMTLDDIPPEWVEAVEVHRGAFTPVELMRASRFRSCGVIAVWTR